jgi:DNA-binding NarL/FixJ family response regulator
MARVLSVVLVRGLHARRPIRFGGRIEPGAGRLDSPTAIVEVGQQPVSAPAPPVICKARLCLLGNSALDRLAYRLLLADQLGFDLAAESDFTPAAIWISLRSKPDIVLLNADTAFTEAIDAARMISRLLPTARILVVGASVDPTQIQAWSRCTIHGYVVKDGGMAELKAALQAATQKQQYYSEGVRDIVCRATRNGGSPRLSRRETELLPLLARGLSLRDAALKMTVSYKTADSYRTNLLRKLGLHDRVELARYAIRERIIDP